ncbi:hypothetical protein SKUL_45 [Pseudomonas phage Skulduggery]|uniref:DUF1364 domain-containing protein n=1 Tax=Pseudomonas phage Skulduggery TaxID=2006671 RepID=A0A1Y0SX23_9CAUD|nr:HNH endonuclease [Pseudomonas phage Skulduggery]ARV77144.1 hypothetical protein SKUL_45 [Pseudomonas phage Skulduggery]
MSKQNRITKAARGRNCQVRIPGCPNNTETVVLAHFRLAGTRSGMGIKPNDLQAAWCCDWCHSIVDGRQKSEFSQDELRLWHAEGCFRTIQALLDEDIIKL